MEPVVTDTYEEFIRDKMYNQAVEELACNFAVFKNTTNLNEFKSNNKNTVQSNNKNTVQSANKNTVKSRIKDEYSYDYDGEAIPLKKNNIKNPDKVNVLNTRYIIHHKDQFMKKVGSKNKLYQGVKT